MEEIIEKILAEPKILQWKVNQLQSWVRMIHDAMVTLVPSDTIAEKLSTEITEYREALSKINLRLNDYIGQEEERERIEIEHQLLIIKLENLQELREKKQSLEQLNEVLNEMSNLSTVNGEMIDQQVRTLETVVKIFDATDVPLESQLSGLSFILKSNLEKVKADQFNTLEQIPLIPLKSKFEKLTQEITFKIQEFNQYATKLAIIKSDLDSIAGERDQIIDSFKTHHLQNEQIYGALTSREGPRFYIEKLSTEVDERLKTYDAELRTLIANRDILPIYELKEINKDL